MNGLWEFLSMGGYGFYVWTSYGLVALVLVMNAVLPGLKEQRLKRELQGELASRAPSPPGETPR